MYSLHICESPQWGEMWDVWDKEKYVSKTEWCDRFGFVRGGEYRVHSETSSYHTNDTTHSHDEKETKERVVLCCEFHNGTCVCVRFVRAWSARILIISLKVISLVSVCTRELRILFVRSLTNIVDEKNHHKRPTTRIPTPEHTGTQRLEPLSWRMVSVWRLCTMILSWCGLKIYLELSYNPNVSAQDMMRSMWFVRFEDQERTMLLHFNVLDMSCYTRIEEMHSIVGDVSRNSHKMLR